MKRLAIAVSVTALGGVVAGYYGGMVWRVFSGIIWSKLLVLLLAAVWATSLLHPWARAHSELRDVLRERGVAVTSRMDTLPVGLMEAQAFKRASTCFGLGRYLYNFVEMWVPLNDHRQPLELPSLPNWALPKSAVVQRGPIDQNTTARIETFRRALGGPIYGEILRRVAHADRANGIPNAQLQQEVVRAMERAERGLDKANSLAEQIDESAVISILDGLRIESMAAIPRLAALKLLVAELEQAAQRTAA